MPTESTRSLLEDLGWLRALARRLARDPHLADDLVQDACTIALTQRAPLRQPRAWFTTVLRNLLHAHRRRERARQRHAGGSEPGSFDDAASLLQRAETQHRLAAAVLQLEEPYRTTVLLRFFDGLPPRRIAARQGVPTATVHSRLQRAMQQLRERLDQTCGSRRAWLAAFVPFAFPAAASALPTTFLLMHTNLKLLAAAAAAVACTAPFWWPTARADADALDPARLVAPDGNRNGGAGGGGRGAQHLGDARPERSAAAPAPAELPPPAVRFQVQGRVCDSAGAGLPGVHIGANGNLETAVQSDAVGNFTFDLPAGTTTLAAADDHFVTVLAATWSPEARIAPVVVVARAVTLAGSVVDVHGTTIAGAQVVLQLPADFDARFPVPLDRAERRRWQASSGTNGSFALGRLPLLDGATLFVAADAYAPVTQPLPTADTSDLRIVLQRFRYEAGELLGRVVDPAGAPVEGARVAMGVTSVVTDRDGRFGVSLRRAGWPTAIVAAKAGYGPGRCEVPKNGGTRREDWPAELVLRLLPAPQSVRGRVVDQHGKGLAGAEVWIADPTPLGIAGVLPLQLEYLIAGGAVPKQAARMRVPHAEDPTQDGNVTNQRGIAREPTASWFYATADAQGAFELPGLLDRSYTLRALDPGTGLFGEASAVFGGSWQQITIARDDVWPEVRGRVLSKGGRPIAGVAVRQHVVAFRTDARVPGGRFEGTALREGRTATTGDDGSFVLRDVGKRHYHVSLSGDPIVPTEVAAAQIADPLQCAFVVEARCHVEVALQDPDEADAVACVDAGGEGVDLAILRSNSNQFETDLPLHAGRSGLFVVGESAAKLLLQKGGRTVREIPFTPDPTKTTTVQ